MGTDVCGSSEVRQLELTDAEGGVVRPVAPVLHLLCILKKSRVGIMTQLYLISLPS